MLLWHWTICYLRKILWCFFSRLTLACNSTNRNALLLFFPVFPGFALVFCLKLRLCRCVAFAAAHLAVTSVNTTTTKTTTTCHYHRLHHDAARSEQKQIQTKVAPITCSYRMLWQLSWRKKFQDFDVISPSRSAVYKQRCIFTYQLVVEV